MLTPDEVRIKLKDMNLKAVARNAGLGYMTVYNLTKGKDCRGSVIEKLSKYLEDKENAK